MKTFNLEKSYIIPFVIVGCIASFGGSSIYYYLPKAFLSLDYSLILNMFFIILTGFILGLTLLANNLQGILELLIAKVFFFWEVRGMRILLGKNLVMHKTRNKLTSIIYALTLGCIIFLLVSANLQI